MIIYYSATTAYRAGIYANPISQAIIVYKRPTVAKQLLLPMLFATGINVLQQPGL
jgi:hypothetical protein